MLDLIMRERGGRKRDERGSDEVGREKKLLLSMRADKKENSSRLMDEILY